MFLDIALNIFKKYSTDIVCGTKTFETLLTKLIKANPNFFIKNKETVFKVFQKYVLNFEESNNNKIMIQEFIF